MIRVTSLMYIETENGPHLTAIYSEIDDNGRIISTNNRYDGLLINEDYIQKAKDLKSHALELIEKTK